MITIYFIFNYNIIVEANWEHNKFIQLYQNLPVYNRNNNNNNKTYNIDIFVNQHIKYIFLKKQLALKSYWGESLAARQLIEGRHIFFFFFFLFFQKKKLFY